MKTGGVILAAGMSARMHTYKLMLPVAGKRMIQWSVDNMRQGGAGQIVVVTGYNQEVIEEYIKQQWNEEVSVVHNPDYANGKMFDSVRTGFQALKGYEYAFLALADMPAISPDTYLQLYEEMVKQEKKAVIPVVAGKRCHPPLFSKEAVCSILAYSGENGLRGYYRTIPGELYEMPVNDKGCLLDADTPEDLKQLERYLNQAE